METVIALLVIILIGFWAVNILIPMTKSTQYYFQMHIFLWL